HGGGWWSVPQLLIHDSRCQISRRHRRANRVRCIGWLSNSLDCLAGCHRFRSSWARAAYHKMQFDTEHLSENSRHLEWYRLEQPQLLPKELADAFVQLEQDAETEAFLENSYAKSERLLTQLYHRVAKPLLCMFMSVTSANGFLRRGSMFVLFGEQFRRLIVGSDSGDHQQQQEPLFDSLLDLGAGDGNVTSHYAGYFRRVFATEMATVMTWRLAERGYTVVDPITWLPTQPAIDAEPELDAHYDLIGCFNLLDRCEAPLDLLAQAKRRLRPGSGRLLLAVVVPLRQFCEFAPGNRPRAGSCGQRADIRGAVGQPSQQCAPAAGLGSGAMGQGALPVRRRSVSEFLSPD
uniref:Methyltransf_25 domain-containing protein n=1 Tax=Macrostomum lignano TaxID=282301 RepID=A0A1I8I6D3_9PLAT